MSEQIDFGEYANKIGKIIGENKVNEEKENSPPTPAPTPRKDYRRENRELKSKIRDLENSRATIPTMITIEKLLTKYRIESDTTKFLYNRINGGKKPDRATIQKLLDFLRFCQEKEEI